jgi:hypothetical protein
MDTTITPSTLLGPELAARARRVEAVHRGGPKHWVGDGFHVRGVFPSRSLPMERTSPFLLLDHHPREVYPALTQGRRGVGWHPHRGFETVTVAWEGTVAHRDTAGHAGIIGPGDVQWMTAASGILHEEYHEQEFSRRGGPMRMLQLWVNLPARLKMSEPGYQPITAAQIPAVALDEDAGQVRVIAGEFGGARGPARTHTPITLLDVELRAKGRLVVPLPQDHNALVLVDDALVAALQRVRRIVPADVAASYDAAVLSEPAEVALHKAFAEVSRDVAGLAAFVAAAEGLTAPINTFFDEVLVMAEDPAVKAARLGLLASIRDYAAPVLDWTQL